MTPTSCVDPALAERVLDSARGGRAVLAPDLAEHVASCGECFVALERMRRMTATMRKAAPARAEIAAANVRFLARRSRGGVRRAVPLVFAFASLLCTALAFAAGVRYAVVHGLLSAPAAEPATTPSPESPVAPRKHGRGSRARAPAPPSPPAASLETEVIELSDVVDSGTEVAAVAAPAPLLATAPPLPESPPPPPRTVPAVTRSIQTVAPARPTATPSSWIVAAQAMRTKDYATAERAFDDLAGSSDPKTRDAARLARAQMWIAQGRSAMARPELVALAASGATSLVRDRAAEALRAIDDH